MAKIRAPRRSADDYAETLADLAESITTSAQNEVRRGLSKELRDLTVPGTGRRNLALILQGLGRDDSEVDDRFLAGIRLAAELVGDDDFEC